MPRLGKRASTVAFVGLVATLVVGLGMFAAMALNWVVTEVAYSIERTAAETSRVIPAGTPSLVGLPMQQVRVVFPDHVVMVTPTPVPKGKQTPIPCNDEDDGREVYYGESCIWIDIAPTVEPIICSTPVIGEVCEWRYTLSPQQGQ